MENYNYLLRLVAEGKALDMPILVLRTAQEQGYLTKEQVDLAVVKGRSVRNKRKITSAMENIIEEGDFSQLPILHEAVKKGILDQEQIPLIIEQAIRTAVKYNFPNYRNN